MKDELANYCVWLLYLFVAAVFCWCSRMFLFRCLLYWVRYRVRFECLVFIVVQCVVLYTCFNENTFFALVYVFCFSDIVVVCVGFPTFKCVLDCCCLCLCRRLVFVFFCFGVMVLVS